MAAARKLLLFHLKASNALESCSGFLQGEVPSQAAKWVMQAKSLWSTQHPAQSLKSCRKLAGGHWGPVNKPGTACSCALQCSWGCAGSVAQPGTHQPQGTAKV